MSCLISSALFKVPRNVTLLRRAAQPPPASGAAARHYSSKPRTPPHSDETKIQKSVFISQSSNVFANLALEDWLYKNFDFTNHHVMLLWRNSPCVVIGRHQNPWQETNLGVLHDGGVDIARRNSGGGAVYHDAGNLNATFFTPRERYNRRHNLEIIARTLQSEWNIRTEINAREDIMYDGKYKLAQISGTAAKLGRPNSYHHCTLLVNVNKSMLSQSLHKHEKGIISNATASIPAPTLNLQDICADVSMDRLIKGLGHAYLRTKAISMEDGGAKQMSKQRGFQVINPTDDWFPGLGKTQHDLQSWEWRFGATPKFTVSQSFAVPDEHGGRGQLVISLEIVRGRVESVCFKIPPALVNDEHFLQDAELLCSVQGRQFTETALDDLRDALTARGQSYLGASLGRVVTTV